MTIWVNVSTSATWGQTPFGIVRVEQRVALALQEWLGLDRVRFCIWDRRRGDFVEFCDPGPVGWTRPGAASIGPASLDARPADRTRSPSPPLWQRPLDLASTGLRSVADRGARLAEWARRAAWQRGGSASGCLRPGDVLITLGLEWETGFMPMLGVLKERLGIRIIGCCHDLIPIKYPQYCIPYVVKRFPDYLEQLARYCDAIACVSERTLSDLRHWISEAGLPLPRLFKIRLGSDLPAVAGATSDAVSRLISRPYVLFVSTLERRKNHEVLYRAFHRLAQEHGLARLPRLVFVGARGWGVDELLNDIELDPATRGIIVRLHDVSDTELRVLYEHALFCAFPSLYEGWGLPIAEALALGKPVICSNRGSIPEVGGDLVEYVDPWDLPEWVNAIERLWLDVDHRNRLANRIEREYVRNEWSATAEAIGRFALGLESGLPAKG